MPSHIDHIIAPGKDHGHGVSEAVQSILGHLLLPAVMGADDIGHTSVGNGPGVKHVVGAGDDIMDARLFIEREAGLGLDIFQDIEEHALKPLIPDVRFNLVLRYSTYRNPLHRDFYLLFIF